MPAMDTFKIISGLKYITNFRDKHKRNNIEMKYKHMFELLDLDWYGYLELQQMKKKELKENNL